MTGTAPRLLGLLAALFGRDIADGTFAPLIADWQHEWRQAASAPRRARVLWRGGVALATASAVTAGRLAQPWDLPRRDLAAIGFTFAAYAGVGLAIGLSPFVLMPLVYGPLRLAFLAMLAPAILAISLPVALLPTAAAIERRSRLTWPRRGAWVLAAVSTGLMGVLVVHVGWLVPAANTTFQERAASTALGHAWQPPRGLKELTLPELVGETAPAHIEARITTPARRQEAVLRLALITVWPATFALFGWRMSRHRRSPGHAGTLVWWVVAVVTALAVSFGASLGPGYHQLPSVTLAAATWLLAAAALRRPRTHDEPAR